MSAAREQGSLTAKRTPDGGCLLEDPEHGYRREISEADWVRIVAATAVSHATDVEPAVAMLLKGKGKVHVSLNGREIAEVALEIASGLATAPAQRIQVPRAPQLAIPGR